MNKCVNDLFGYCSSTPDYDKQPQEVKLLKEAEGYLSGGHCKLDPHNCINYQLATKVIQPSTIESKFNPIVKEPKVEKSTPKTKKKSTQISLF